MGGSPKPVLLCAVLTLLAIVFNRLGAISETVFPPNYLSDQNRMCSPLPTMDSATALKRAWAFWGIWIDNPAQGQELSVLSSQSHLMRRDHPEYSRSWTPSPPCCRGILSRIQETRQFPPFAFSWPIHRESFHFGRLSLISHLVNQF